MRASGRSTLLTSLAVAQAKVVTPRIMVEFVKAHYTGEYMASVLTHNLNDIKKITYYIEEAQCNPISTKANGRAIIAAARGWPLRSLSPAVTRCCAASQLILK